MTGSQAGTLAAPAFVTRSPRAARLVAAHAHAWLVAGCAVGLLLATLLLSPRLGDWLAPLTYGRWATLHLDLTLYGWLAVPMVGLLLRAYGLASRPAATAFVLALWSGALVAGAVSWLAGETSGKLFLDWTGAPGVLFASAQAGLALTLGAGAWRTYAEEACTRPLPAARRLLALRGLGALALLGVPVALLVAERGDLYPAIDPASGGPTAASLLISSLGFVALLLLTPRLAGLATLRRRGAAWAPVALAAHTAFWARLDSGDRSSDLPQAALLATLAIWIVLLPWELRRFAWPPAARRWLAAMAFWGSLLAVTGVAQFLPLPLAQVKFTHALVAHAHLAMAGFASSYAALLLRLGATPAGAALGEAPAYWLWQLGLAGHLAALFAIGAGEGSDPAFVLRGDATLTALLAVRWLAGLAMLAAALRWLAGPREACR